MVKADSLKVEEAISKHLTSENDKGVDELSGIIITGELLPDNEAIPAEEQNSEQASEKVSQENIPNTYGDLFDTPNLWINIDRTNGNRKEIYISENEVINSLEDLHHDIVEFPDNEEELIAEINK
ncbi:hypothetical protein [Alistipes timonensis]|uniref:hypothetical protein n=1 Tax=Alistipes timonensis TaxID=1465754 RepID=UPI000289FDC5|nr:hypothetical protein [Alistipes timonensis]